MPSESQLMDALADSIDDMDSLVADIKTMLYGDSGTGKTVLGMQILQEFTPPEQEILFIDTGRGWVSLNNYPELKQRTRRMQFQGLSQLDLLVKAITEKRPKFDNIGAIQIDEISTIQVKDTHNVMRGRGESTGEFAAPTQPDMGVTTRRMISTFGPLLTLPQNVIVVSHTREDEVKIGSKATGKYVVRPGMMPGLAKQLQGMVHEVLHLSADIKAPIGGSPTYARSLQVMPTDKIVAKTRISGLDPTVSPKRYVEALRQWVEGSRPSTTAKLDSVDTAIEILD